MALAYRNSTHPINTRYSRLAAKRWLFNLKLIIGNDNKYRQKVNSILINNAQSRSLTNSFYDKCTTNCTTLNSNLLQYIVCTAHAPASLVYYTNKNNECKCTFVHIFTLL